MTTEYLFDVNTLLTEHDLLLKKEAEDRALVNTIEFPDMILFKSKLVEWASIGFPPNYVVYSITLVPPPACSDGVVRNMVEYASYLGGVSLEERVLRLSNKLKGMRLEFTSSPPNFMLNVFKDQDIV